MNRTIEVRRVVTSMVPIRVLRSRRRLMAASNIAPTAPKAPASVGVAMPAKIDPSTARIRNSGGIITSTTRRARSLRFFARASSGNAGAAFGLKMATPPA